MYKVPCGLLASTYTKNIGRTSGWVPACAGKARGVYVSTRPLAISSHALAPGKALCWRLRSGAWFHGRDMLKRFPAEAGVHPSSAREADRWVPAFAGKALWWRASSGAWFHGRDMLKRFPGGSRGPLFERSGGGSVGPGFRRESDSGGGFIRNLVGAVISRPLLLAPRACAAGRSRTRSTRRGGCRPRSCRHAVGSRCHSLSTDRGPSLRRSAWS